MLHNTAGRARKRSALAVGVIAILMAVMTPAAASPERNPWSVVYEPPLTACTEAGEMRGLVLEPRTPGAPFVNFGVDGNAVKVMKIFDIDQHIEIRDAATNELIAEFDFNVEKPGATPLKAETCTINQEVVVPDTPWGTVRITSTGTATVLIAATS